MTKKEFKEKLYELSLLYVLDEDDFENINNIDDLINKIYKLADENDINIQENLYELNLENLVEKYDDINRKIYGKEEYHID